MNSSEIAKLAGVSRSTVSRVVNGYTNVPPATKERVMEIIRKYGYTPNNSARNLAGKPSRVIGLFFIAMEQQEKGIIHSSPFFSEFLVFFADKLQNYGYQLLVSVISSRAHMKNMEAMFAEQMISGGVFMGDLLPLEELESLSNARSKCMLINQRESCDLEHILILNTENYRAAYDAVQALVDLGHTRIGHIAGEQLKASTTERLKGYYDCLHDVGIIYDPRLIVHAKMHQEENGFLAMQQLMQQCEGQYPSALFCCNDLMAIGAMRYLEQKGIRVPQDISVMGYDNSEMSRYTKPPLSTIATSVEKLAVLACDTLVHYIETGNYAPEEKTQMVREYQVVLRESVCKYG